MPSNPPGVRRCAACRGHAEKSGMIRVCRAKDGRIFVDPSGKANGRGVWLHRTKECIALAEKKKALNAAFRCAVPVEVMEALRESV